MPMNQIIQKRSKQSLERLEEIKEKVKAIEVLGELPELCIYVTGSFGRLEASEFSDLDLFFINKGSGKTPIKRLKKTLLDADLIRISETLGFPEFSKDGQFLEIHYLCDMLKNLGSSKDDYENHFTARLLLLLEGRAIHNPGFYENVIKKLVTEYLKDFSGNEESFRPIFLVNDIIRFWRTMCLNYENRRRSPNESKDRISNLKLKFSRLLICYATMILLSIKRPISPEFLLCIFQHSPIERLTLIGSLVPEVKAVIGDLMELYSWFLEETGRKEEEMLRWIGDSQNRSTALENGREFGRLMYDLLIESVPDKETMRYIVV